MAGAEMPGLLVLGVAWPPERFLANLFQGLLQAGMQITLATSSKPGPDWISQPGLTWLRLPGWRASWVAKLVRLAGPAAYSALYGRDDLRVLSGHIRQADRLKDRIALWRRLLPFAGRRWQAIYFPWNFSAIDYLPLFDLGMPVIISCRGSQINVAPHNPERYPLRQGLRETFARATAVHCVSQAILQEAAQYGLDPGKAHVIHPGVDPESFQPANWPRPVDRIYRIITTGSLAWVKGHEDACTALRWLKGWDVPAQFEIVGNGPERQRLLYTIQDLELQDCVQLSGQLPPATLRQRLQNADVFLLSSLSEGLSNAALEAMACGLPVVTADCGGMREAITDGVEGLIVPRREPRALASALNQLWQSPELGKQMGAAGRRRILAEFTLDRQIEGFVQLYRSIGQASRAA
jgi:colanic acid/amylovoran biosynthesis glycosyltransferase